MAAKGPGRSFPLLSDLLKQLSERKELAVPDVDVAVIQLFSLTLYSRLVYNSYGSLIDDVLADKLITAGVDMFLNYYRPPDRRGDGSSDKVVAAGAGPGGHQP